MLVLSGFGYYKQSYYEQLYIGFYVNIVFIFSRKMSKSTITGLYINICLVLFFLIIVKLLLEWLYYFTFPLATYEQSSLSIVLPASGIALFCVHFW